jgi:sialidase-1
MMPLSLSTSLRVFAFSAFFASAAGAEHPAKPARNLAREATVSTPHPPLRLQRMPEKAIDGVVGDNADSGWVPAVNDVSPTRPVLLALTWKEAVEIDRVVLRYIEGKSWRFVDYTLATWESVEAPKLGAPASEFPHEDIFVGGDGLYNTYRIPALVTSKRGTILAFCEGRRLSARDSGDIDLLLKRSSDHGRTWGPLQVIHTEPGNVTLGNPVPIADRATGDIHLVYARDGRQLFHRVSHDDGTTFSDAMDITAPVAEMATQHGIDWNHVLPHPGRGLHTSKGRLIVQIKTAGHKRGGPSRRVGAIYSDDRGHTWKPGGWVPPTRGETSESTMFEMGDGTIVMNTRWHDGAHRLVSHSGDGGLTWSAPEPHLELPDLVCQGSILRASSTPDQRRVYFSNIVPEPSSSQVIVGRRSRLVVRASDDDGMTWPFARVVVPGPAGYSDLTIAPNGNLLVLFEAGASIYSEKLTLATLAPSTWESELARSRAELSRERYDYTRAKETMRSSAWKLHVEVRASRASGQAEHVFGFPVKTRTLLLAVTKVEQPEGMAYLQEIEAWGR